MGQGCHAAHGQPVAPETPPPPKAQARPAAAQALHLIEKILPQETKELPRQQTNQMLDVGYNSDSARSWSGYNIHIYLEHVQLH